eukprot:1147688-Pelagomonas_calceolata.AAC.1
MAKWSFAAHDHCAQMCLWADPGRGLIKLSQCSQNTLGSSVNQRNILPKKLQICPQTEEITATKNTKPNRKPPRKRKRSRHRASITPPVHPTHNLLLPVDTIQPNVLPFP